MLNLVLLLIFLIVAAAMWFQGLWNSVVTLINLLLAMMLAFNYFEPLADLIDKQDRSYTYLVDFLALWGLFVLSFGLLRLFTDMLSRKRVVFRLLDRNGRAQHPGALGRLVVCRFHLCQLHTAPLGPHPMGFQQTPTSGNFLGMAPGRGWLAFMQSRSRGALSRGESDAAKRSPLSEDQNVNVRIFDPESRFILKYYQRRKNFESEPDYRVAR